MQPWSHTDIVIEIKMITVYQNSMKCKVNHSMGDLTFGKFDRTKNNLLIKMIYTYAEKYKGFNI